MPHRILFVCLGNICRSPAAEGAFQKLVTSLGRSHEFVLDSAGTSGEHDGELPHSETRATAKKRGISLTHRSRRVTREDFDAFDWLVAMDASNERELLRLASSEKARVIRFRRYEEGADSLDVPDPWYTGEFERVMDICERASLGLLAAIDARAI